MPKHTRLRSDIEKLKDPKVLEIFQAMIGGRFAPLTIMSNDETDIDSMISTFNTAVTETASEILGKHRQKKTTKKNKTKKTTTTAGSLQKSLIYATKGEK